MQVPFFEIDFIRIHHPIDAHPQPPTVPNDEIQVEPALPPGSFSGAVPPCDEPESKASGHAAGASRVKLTNTVEIRTDLEGYNSGRVYYIRAESGAECRRIADDLTAHYTTARRKFELRSRWERYRDRIKTAYDSIFTQGLVGALILTVSCAHLCSGARSRGKALGLVPRIAVRRSCLLGPPPPPFPPDRALRHDDVAQMVPH